MSSLQEISGDPVRREGLARWCQYSSRSEANEAHVRYQALSANKIDAHTGYSGTRVGIIRISDRKCGYVLTSLGIDGRRKT